MSITTRSLSKAILVTLLASAASFAGSVAPDLNALSSNTVLQVIVGLNPAQTPSPANMIGAVTVATLPSALVLQTTAGTAINLATDPAVSHVAVNHTLIGSGSFVYDYLPAAVQPVSAPYAGIAPAGSFGAGVGVAVIDSGIHTGSTDLIGNGRNGVGASRVWYSQSFIPYETTPDDLYGHGTHVAGIIAGDGSNSYGPLYFNDIHGVAPGAHLINLKVIDQNGVSNDAEVIQAIQTAIQLKDVFNIQVINLSLGRPAFESYTVDPLDQAVEQAWAAGITVVVAAGNGGRHEPGAITRGYGTIEVPGNDPLVITVGAMNTKGTATRSDDIITSYSSKGPTMGDAVVKPDLVAPGNLIFSIRIPGSTLDLAEPTNAAPLSAYVTSPAGQAQNYFVLSGTSMAAAATSGAVASLLSTSANANLTPDQVKARLMLTATKNFPQYSIITDSITGQKFDVAYDIFTVGAGYLNLDAAIASTATLPTGMNAASPIANVNGTLDANGRAIVTIVNDLSAVWGSSAV